MRQCAQETKSCRKHNLTISLHRNAKSHVVSKEAFNIFALLVGVMLPIALLIVAFML